MEMLSSKITIIVMSCDSYSDIWKYFVMCLDKYWNNKDIKRLLVTDTIVGPIDGFSTVVSCGSNLQWTDRLSRAIDKVETPYILLLLEDFFLKNTIDENIYCEIVDKMDEYNIGVFKLMPDIGKGIVWSKDNQYLLYEKGQPYRISTLPSIWNKSYLKKLTGVSNSAWQFEREITYYSNQFDEMVLGISGNAFIYAHAIKRGKWQDEGLDLLKQIGIEIDFSVRKKRNLFDKIRQIIIDFVFNLSPELVVRLQNKLSQ